jgi:hypothetical protein
MSYQDKWNNIVQQQNKLHGKSEEVVQYAWESVILPTCLSYNNINIDPQRSIQMGSTSKRIDIVVKQEKDLYIIELKKSNLHNGQDQLFSYLKQMKEIS